MLKLAWYIISVLTILLILLNSPSNNNVNSFGNQNKLFSMRSNQLLVQKFIILNVLLFIIFATLCSIYIKT